MPSLLDKLKGKQGDLSDYKFAELLNRPQQLWQMTRTGKRKVGMSILTALPKPYPDLAFDVLIFLGFDVSNITSVLENHTDSPEASPVQTLRGFWGRLKAIWKVK